MNYDFESVKARGGNPDPFYFCKVCGAYNNPFNYRDKEFEKMKTKNVCPMCWGKKEELFAEANSKQAQEKVRRDLQ